MSAVEVILLEKVDSLGDLGDTVRVKPGYARNYLFPQQKALRATKGNIAYFEAQKKEIEKRNEANRKDAEKRAKALEGIMVNIIRHASESGHLYGSVSSRDIADAVLETTKEKVGRSAVEMNQAFKTIGLFLVPVALHPEVKVEVTINIARSEDEAKIQAKTGKALIADNEADEEAEKAEAEAAAAEAAAEAKKELMEEDALEAEKVAEAEEAAAKAEEEAKAAEKAEAKAAKKVVEDDVEDSEAETAESETEAEKDAE